MALLALGATGLAMALAAFAICEIVKSRCPASPRFERWPAPEGRVVRVSTTMAGFDYQTYLDLLGKVDAARTADEKGATFENLAAYSLAALDGIEITARDAVMASEEIDLVLWNAGTEAVLRAWSDIILVECKNWTAKVTAKDLSWFVTKIQERALSTGILFAANGVTGDYDSTADPVGARHVVRTALLKRIRVITITIEDLRLITCLDDLRRLLKWRYSGIFVHNVLADWQYPASVAAHTPPPTS